MAMTVTYERPRSQSKFSQNSPLTGLCHFQSAQQHLLPCSTNKTGPAVSGPQVWGQQLFCPKITVLQLFKLHIEVEICGCLSHLMTHFGALAHPWSVLRNACHSASPLLGWQLSEGLDSNKQKNSAVAAAAPSQGIYRAFKDRHT